MNYTIAEDEYEGSDYDDDVFINEIRDDDFINEVRKNLISCC